MKWLRENWDDILKYFWCLVFFAILYLLLTTNTDMGHNSHSFDLGGEW